MNFIDFYYFFEFHRTRKTIENNSFCYSLNLVHDLQNRCFAPNLMTFFHFKVVKFFCSKFINIFLLQISLPFFAQIFFFISRFFC